MDCDEEIVTISSSEDENDEIRCLSVKNGSKRQSNSKNGSKNATIKRKRRGPPSAPQRRNSHLNKSDNNGHEHVNSTVATDSNQSQRKMPPQSFESFNERESDEDICSIEDEWNEDGDKLNEAANGHSNVNVKKRDKATNGKSSAAEKSSEFKRNAPDRKKCMLCRQKLATLSSVRPEELTGEIEDEAITDARINIEVEGAENNEDLQFKLVDFSVFDENYHLVPVLAENLKLTQTRLYFSGLLVPIYTDDDGINSDCTNGPNSIDLNSLGVRVKKSNRIIGWSNEIAEGEKENIMLTTAVKDREVLYTLGYPAQVYRDIYLRTYKMCFVSNRIICRLIDAYHESVNLEFGDLVQFCQAIDPPVVFGQSLAPIDEEYIVGKVNFLAEQMYAYENGGDEDELLTIVTSEAAKHIIELSPYSPEEARGQQEPRRRGRRRQSQDMPEAKADKAVTTSLVREKFEALFKNEFKSSDVTKEEDKKTCGKCVNCRKSNCGRCDQCLLMISYGGTVADNGIICVERECHHRHVLITLSDDDDNPKADRASINSVRVEWGPTASQYSDRYEEDIIKYQVANIVLPNAKQVQIKAGSFILFPDDLGFEGTPLQVGRVVSLYQMKGANLSADRRKKQDWLDLAHVQIFARSHSTCLGTTANYNEFFITTICSDIFLSTVRHVLEIDYRPIKDSAAWKEQGGEEVVKDGVDNERYFWRLQYDPVNDRIEEPYPNLVEIKHNGICNLCRLYEQKGLEDVFRVEINDTVPNIQLGTKPVTVNQFIYLKDNILEKWGMKYNWPGSIVLPATSYRPAVKTRELGSHKEVSLLVVVQLVKIFTNKVRLRLLYRPENTGFPWKTTRKENMAELYYTERFEILTHKELKEYSVLHYLPEVVFWNDPFNELPTDLLNWLEAGLDRFVITKKFRTVYNMELHKPDNDNLCVALSLLKEHELRDLVKFDPIIHKDKCAPVVPLKTLDLFCGAGGLSTGLEQSGAVDVKWAVEYSRPAAKAFELNHREADVYITDCNLLLEKLMRGEKSDLPPKSEVEMIVGGPPCQGFSSMNLYRQTTIAKLKNSCVTTFLSYCDFYRPRFVVMENVNDLVSDEHGLTIQLIMATLVQIGYQVTFSVLHAAHYGVGQKRRRMIMIGAGPGEKLPQLPHPRYAYTAKWNQTITINYRKVTKIWGRPAATRRYVTTWDVISDLPSIRSDESRDTLKYKDAESYLQKVYYRNESGLVKDHIVKPITELNQARIDHVPPEPLRDWTYIPNKALTLSSGKKVHPVQFNYIVGETGELRGVCNCARSTKNRKFACDEDDRQSHTLIPWFTLHTLHRRNDGWKGVFGRIPWNGMFRTTLTDPSPTSSQGQVLHPEENRICSVREFARSQGFKDSFVFYGTVQDKLRQIGNAVPPPLGHAIGLEIRKSLADEAF